MAKKFKCTMCGYVHEGDKAPEKCPMCQQPASVFEEIKEEAAAPAEAPKKKGLNTNSNVYTVLYAVILCGLVAVLLSAAALGLKDKQKANTDNEKKQQILMAVAGPLQQAGICEEVTFDNAAEIWEKLDMDSNMACVTPSGELLMENPFETAAKSLFAKGQVKEDAKLPFYCAIINDEPYYIMCMYGAGLWDAIWGYIAVEGDANTIAGASFDHAGETAGLGAKIKDDPAFAAAFIGKTVFQNGEFAPVVVSKKNVDNKVDAITGATKTSDCVSDMVRNSLQGYAAALQQLSGAPAAGDCCGKKAEGCCGKCGENGGKCSNHEGGECKHGEGECNGECKEGEAEPKAE